LHGLWGGQVLGFYRSDIFGYLHQLRRRSSCRVFVLPLRASSKKIAGASFLFLVLVQLSVEDSLIAAVRICGKRSEQDHVQTSG
jgi:hypothetical protein